MGNSEGWKPQKVGGCGWTRCPRNRVLDHVAKDMARSWFVAVGSQSTQNLGLLGSFWAVSRTYGGFRGPQRARWHRKVKSHVECTHRFPLFGRFEWVLGLFWSKNGCFGPKLQFLKPRSATCDSCSRPPSLSFWLILCRVVPHTHRYHPPKFQPNPKHHDGILIFPHFARAAACLLLAAACCCLLLLNLVCPP